ncbi:creatininase family protein [Gayadomonas joobiniege]|uniref:creatininase family protein n=1 Tax=Gayadomonas joobiniege TaxID=1234606 RepID=UPI00035EF20D|nr:creatininase family protein [Gayadomonas joobiniege]
MALKLWKDLSTLDFENIDPHNTIALLPLGAIEPHGPHLPMSTDALIAEELCKLAAEKVPEDINLLLMPTQEVGKSTEHACFEGTLTHSAHTLLDVWMEIGESVHKAGIQKLVFFNAHGGQPQIMEVCCRELRVKFDMLTVGASGWSFGSPDTQDIPEDERKHGIHAGQVETSIMLHLAPELVKMEHAQNFEGLLKDVENNFEHLRIIGSTYVGWQAQDLHPCGCSGDATLATSELGKLYTDHYTEGLKNLLVDVAKYPLDWIRNRSDWK